MSQWKIQITIFLRGTEIRYILKVNCNFKPLNKLLWSSCLFELIQTSKPTVHRVATAPISKKGWSQSEKSLSLAHYICSNQSWITKHFGSVWLFLSKNIKLRFSSLFRLPFWTKSNIQAHCAPRRNSTKWSPEGRCACEKTTIHIGINLMQGYSLLSYLMYAYITSIL